MKQQSGLDHSLCSDLDSFSSALEKSDELKDQWGATRKKLNQTEQAIPKKKFLGDDLNKKVKKSNQPQTDHSTARQKNNTRTQAYQREIY